MKQDNQIAYLEVNLIDPHPHNPRRDLGDLTELSDSIRENGIMQNLTVVRQPWSVNDTKPVRYTAIIGHRRLAAAKLAGLTEIPCVIAEMDEKTQVSTMLQENMQRSDLTVLEQGQGYQMMLDLGETAQSAAKKTGFSESTVRKRLFIASLDAKKTKSAYERGATLEDYMKLQQLTNEKNRNAVLESIGTHNFSHQLRNAIAEELRDRVAPDIIKMVETFAKQTDKPSWEIKGYSQHSIFRYVDYEEKGEDSIAIPKKWKPDEYLYNISLYHIAIYKQDKDFKGEKKMAELPPEEQEARRENRRKYKSLKEMGETTYHLRQEFVKSYSQRSAFSTAQLEAISQFAFASVCLGASVNFDDFTKLEGLEAEDSWRLTYSQKKDVMKKAEIPASRLLLVSLYTTFKDNGENTYFHGAETSAEKRGMHKENNKLDAIYDCICALGYTMSDEEAALRDGSHGMFVVGGM